jgi:hypothetical protein
MEWEIVIGLEEVAPDAANSSEDEEDNKGRVDKGRRPYPPIIK